MFQSSKRLYVFNVLFILTIVSFEKSEAIPLFGKKYETKCFTCHVSEPMLNDFGRKFQASGYSIAGTKDKTPVWAQTLPTFSVLVGPGFEYSKSGNESSMSFANFGFDILTGGSLGENMSYFGAVVVDPKDEGGYEAAVESFVFNFHNIVGEMNNVNLRFGKMRFFIPHQLNLGLSSSAYLSYEYDPFDGLEGQPATHFLLGEAQYAVSVAGWLDNIFDGARYEIALTNGNTAGANLNDNNAIYATLSQTINLGNSPFRLGGFYYGGKQTADSAIINNFSRIGVDVDLYDPIANKINLFGQYVIAEDDNIGGEKLQMTGGFAGAIVPLSPEKIFGYARYDFMNLKEANEDITQITVGARYHLEANIYVYGEFSNNTVNSITSEAVSIGMALAY